MTKEYDPLFTGTPKYAKATRTEKYNYVKTKVNIKNCNRLSPDNHKHAKTNKKHPGSEIIQTTEINTKRVSQPSAENTVQATRKDPENYNDDISLSLRENTVQGTLKEPENNNDDISLSLLENYPNLDSIHNSDIDNVSKKKGKGKTHGSKTCEADASITSLKVNEQIFATSRQPTSSRKSYTVPAVVKYPDKKVKKKHSSKQKKKLKKPFS